MGRDQRAKTENIQLRPHSGHMDFYAVGFRIKMIRHTSLSAFQGKNVLVNPRFGHTHFDSNNFDRHPVVNPVHHCALFIRQHWRGFPDHCKLSPLSWIVFAGQIMAITEVTPRRLACSCPCRRQIYREFQRPRVT